MKKSAFFALSFFCFFLGFAQSPQYVGHRGSYLGVENTYAAFVNGAQKYPYIECDIRVTADSAIVISHDLTTNRVGGNLEVAKAVLAQLKAENYVQERYGVTYVGRISTLEEYLAVCDTFSVTPVIELKWSTGINNDDCSLIPLLVKELEKCSFRNRCVILTSMKKCLEYFQDNYPDIKLQFLGGEKWKNSIDWILSHKIDVDLIHTAVTADDVKMLHDAGLKVNTWTVDDPARAEELTSMGVDMITTNKL